MVNYWTHGTLVAMMKGDDVDEQKGDTIYPDLMKKRFCGCQALVLE